MKTYTYFATSTPISSVRIFDGSLMKYGIQVTQKNTNSIGFSEIFCVEDEKVTLEVIQLSGGRAEFRSIHDDNNQSMVKILNAIRFEFSTEIYSNHQYQFHGYASEAMAEAAFDNHDSRPEDEQFYENLLIGLARGQCPFELNDLRHRKYAIALEETKKSAYLVLPSNKKDLLFKVYARYRDEMLSLEPGSSQDLLKSFEPPDEIPF